MSGIDQIAAALASATEPTPVQFAGATYRVLPPMDWRQSAMSAVRAGDFNTWAVLVMVNDEKVAEDGTKSGLNDGGLFVAADLTNRDVAAFFEAYASAAGASPGE